MLVHYSPASVDPLDGRLAKTLAGVPDATEERRGGLGAAVAARLVETVRTTATTTPHPLHVAPRDRHLAAGPTGDRHARRLARVDGPAVVRRQAQVDGPDDLTRDDYAPDYNEVKRLRRGDVHDRTQAQTDTSRFFNANPVTWTAPR